MNDRPNVNDDLTEDERELQELVSAPTFRKMLWGFETPDLETLLNHGVDSGVSGLIYYRETSAIYDKYREEIDGLFAESVTEGVVDAKRYFADADGDLYADEAQRKNWMVWFAAELLAHNWEEQITERDRLYGEIYDYSEILRKAERAAKEGEPVSADDVDEAMQMLSQLEAEYSDLLEQIPD